MFDVPVLVLSFNRPDKTRGLLNRLRAVAPRTVYYAVDGPRWGHPTDSAKCAAVASLVDAIDWEATIKTRIQTENHGCRDGVVNAVDWFFEHEPEGIILEDDCWPTPDFFPFCREMLNRYRHNERIFQISGTHWGLTSRAEVGASYFFSYYSLIWGWASWRRAWRQRDVDMKRWRQLKNPDAFLKAYFPRRKERRYRQQNFDRVAQDTVDTWDYQWHFTQLAANALNVVPSENLVTNVGLGPDATHTRETSGLRNVFDLDTGAMSFPLSHPHRVEPFAPFHRRVSHDFRYRPRDVAAWAKAKIRRRLYPLRHLRDGAELAGLKGRDVARAWAARYRVNRPRVLNFNANDICNSKCTMCNIWQRKQEIEVTPDEVRAALSDPFFANVTAVGITGGEPTLRRDLPELYQAAIDALPNLESLSVITNAIRAEQVIERLEQVRAVAARARKPLGVMVSLDGVGEVHDRVRGTPGNFASAEQVLTYFREVDPTRLSVGCTVSKANAWDADDLLYYLRKHGIYGRFRVAEFIRRLYNDDRTEVIRNFSDDETYHLALFFKKLELGYERHDLYRRTYRSIHSMLLGSSRAIGCPYHTDGVVLSPRGELAYCAPKSKPLGSLLKHSAHHLYRQGLPEKRRILGNDCQSCIHDYHAERTYRERKAELIDKAWRAVFLRGTPALHRVLQISLPPLQAPGPVIMVVGWYGTETVGDKAILGGIVDHYRKERGTFHLVVASLYPFVTERTLRELDITGTVVPAFSPDCLRWARSADEVVMGGGPLMHLEELAVPLTAFRWAKAHGRRTVIFGCGIGPLEGDEYVAQVRALLHLADVRWFRDAASRQWAVDAGLEPGTTACVEDPARPYVSRVAPNIAPSPRPEVACFLREWTTEYAQGLTRRQFLHRRRDFERGVAQILKREAEQVGASKIRLYAMHNFVVGNDDRDFARRFIDTFFTDDPRVSFDPKLSTVETTVAAMKSSLVNVCMRFHSVLFAETLRVPFKAIDYTQGGKIERYLSDRNRLEHLIRFDEVCALI